MLAADQAFATTPAGYVSGIALPVLLLGLGWLLKRTFGRFETLLDEHSKALAASSTALAVLVQQFAPMQQKQVEHDGSIGSLQRATAVLESRVSEHSDWAAKEHERLLSLASRVG